MNKTKYLLSAAVLLAILGSAYLLSWGIRHFSGGDPLVRVTGLSERSITSDLIILPIVIKSHAVNQPLAYEVLQDAKVKTLTFLKKHGLEDKELTIGSISVEEIKKEMWDSTRNTYVTVDGLGYSLSMPITIKSSKVDKVEGIMSSISELIASSVDLTVGIPRYHYTKLNALKAEMLKEASADALNRARIIAEGGGGSLGDLKSTTMGVFQIVGLYEDEEYSWGGSYNTTSKYKTASVTVKANYEID